MLGVAVAALSRASPVAKQLRTLVSRSRRDHQAELRRSLTAAGFLVCRAAAAVTAMPGRAKASPVCGPDQSEDLEGSRGAKAGAIQDEPEADGEGTAAVAYEPTPNLGDPEIVKSPSDPKQYRYIRLQNDLCALLISDLNNPDGSPCALSSEGEDDSEEDTDEDEDSGAEIEDDQEGYDDECGDYDEDLDDPDSELEELGDKEETRKRNCTEKQSAAALCIGVGSFSDPEDLPGLAHFLEHNHCHQLIVRLLLLPQKAAPGVFLSSSVDLLQLLPHMLPAFRLAFWCCSYSSSWLISSSDFTASHQSTS